MKKIFLNFFVLLFLTFFIQNANAQVIDSVLNIYDEQFPHEKVHIHFDRTMYNKGETIFYKLYILSGLEWTNLSRNVYLVWYDNSGNFIKQTVAPLYQSSAKGSFQVPANYKGDFLRVKAYTRWMLNDEADFMYEKDIAINDASTAKTKTISAQKTRVDVFPEGGVLVNNLASKVAFKATNGYGMPVFIKGFLVNDKNKIIDTLKVAHDGMGFFRLNPIAGEKYQLNWTDENAQKGVTPILPANKEGVVLKVTMDNEKAYAQVERTLDVPQHYKHMRLLVHQNQLILYKVDFKGEERQVQKVGLPIDELPTGVVQFSLFTNDWQPIAERIILVNNRLHEFNAKLTVDIANVSKRSKNVFEIYVKDTSAANMSIAVTDASIVMPEQQTIYSDFLLSNDIRGKVYNPAYYFSSDADSVAAHLDLVMLTNGWRKFDWDKIKAGVLPVLTYPRETDLMKITGKVYGISAAKSSDQLLLNLIINGRDSSKKIIFLPVSKDGSFEDKSIFYYDTSRIFYGLNGKSKSNSVAVHFENGLLKQEFKKLPIDPGSFYRNWTDSMARAKLYFIMLEQEKQRKLLEAMTLKEVIVKSRVKSPIQLLDEKYATGLFSGNDGTAFDLSSDPNATGAIDILTYLQAKVAGLSISVNGTPTATWRGSNTEFFLNEVSTPIETVQSLNITDIAYIKAIRPPFFGSFGGGGGGAIAIYTKRGSSNRGNNNNSVGMENTVLGGYSVFKEFYNPNYEKPPENFEPDNRTTLYWNPYVLTNKRNPRIRIEFYNNDISKKLQIVLEGINSSGKLARVVKIIE
ncbi:MAG: hypothetical protein WCJ68_02670 [Chitinophagia bacterium]